MGHLPALKQNSPDARSCAHMLTTPRYMAGLNDCKLTGQSACYSCMIVEHKGSSKNRSQFCRWYKRPRMALRRGVLQAAAPGPDVKKSFKASMVPSRGGSGSVASQLQKAAAAPPDWRNCLTMACLLAESIQGLAEIHQTLACYMQYPDPLESLTSLSYLTGQKMGRGALLCMH